MKKRLFGFAMSGIVLVFTVGLVGCVPDSAETYVPSPIMPDLPAAPYITAAPDYGNNGVRLTWEKVPGADNYIVYYGLVANTELFTREGTTSWNYYSFLYRNEDKNKYYYAVKAVNKTGTSGFSNVVSWDW